MTGWMVEALLASTVLMALVMMLRRPVVRIFGARAAYLLWALPVLRLLLPPLPTQTVLPQALGQGALVVFHQQAATMTGIVTDQAAGLPWIELAMALWIGGAVLFAGIQVIGYFRFRRMLLADGVIIGREGRITIIESAHASGPLAFGVLRKYVALPVDFTDRYEAEERAFALAHECAHHDRGDLAANMAALGVLALHWCNPLAWIAYGAFRADQELACDALVLARHKHADAAVYGRAILKAASGRHFAAACHLRTVDNLKGRLKMLATHSASLHRISWGMAVIAAVTVSGLALTASGSGAARQMAEVSRTVSDAKLTKLASFLPMVSEVSPPKAVVAPKAPTAPTAPQAAASVAQTHVPAPVMAQVPSMAPVAPTPPDLSGVPTAEEMSAMIPRIDVVPGCGPDGQVTTRTTTRANGRAEHVQIMICQRVADARRTERAAEAQARRAERSAEAAAQRGEMAARRGEMEARRGDIEGRQAALAGLRKAREGVARADGSRDRAMSATIRAQVLADLDREIARLNAGID